MRRGLVFVALLATLTVPSAASAAAWLPPTSLGRLFQSPEMVVLPSGEVVVAWPNGGADARVFAAVRPPGGPFGPTRVISGDSPDQMGIAANARGDVMVVWRDADADGDIRTHFNLRPAGGSFAPEGTELSPDNENTADPTVALDPLGNALVAWTRGPGDGHLFASFRPAGGTFGAPDEISAANSDDPELGFEPNGDAVAVWQGGAIDNGIMRALRPAGGSFGSPAPLSDDTDGFGFPQLSMDPAGNAIAAWTQTTGATTNRVQVSMKSAAGDFGSSPFVSPAGQDHSLEDVAHDAGGNALVMWRQDSPDQAQAAFRPAGGSFGGPTILSDGTGSGGAAAFDGTGGSLFVWNVVSGSMGRARSVTRTPGGVLGSRVFASPLGVDVISVGSVGADAQGNGAALFTIDAGSQNEVRVAGYDAVAPRIDSVSVPASGGSDRSIAFSARAFDVWGPLTYLWRFGDGSTATGAQVAHTYRSITGPRQVQLTVTDAAGQSATATRAITLRDVTRPVLSRVRWSPAVFPGGSRLRYRLSEAARVSATIQRRTSGRRVGRRCRRATRRNRTRRRCVRWVSVRGGVLRQRGKQGNNSRRFGGKVRRRKLRRGRYRAVVRAVDAAGLRSRTRTARFRIVRRR